MKRWKIIDEDEAAADRPTEAPRLTALDVRGEHRVLSGFTTHDLGSLQLVAEGSPLVRYRWYVDLHDPGRGEFTAEGGEPVKPGQRLIARDGTDPELVGRAAARLRPGGRTDGRLSTSLGRRHARARAVCPGSFRTAKV